MAESNLFDAQPDFIATEKGHPTALFKGQIYTIHTKNNDHTIWRCRKRNCRGRLRTLEDGRYAGQPVLHNHGGCAAEVEKTKILCAMRCQARDATVITSAQIYDRCVQGVSSEVLDLLPLRKSCIRTINNLRPSMSYRIDWANLPHFLRVTAGDSRPFLRYRYRYKPVTFSDM